MQSSGVFARSDFPANSDYFPILDQHAPLARFRGDSAQELRAVRELLVPVMALLDQETRLPLDGLRRDGVRPRRAEQAQAGAEAIGVVLAGRADAARLLGPPEQAAALVAHALLADCANAQAGWANALTTVATLATQ